MRKVRILALVLVVAVMLVGAAYALWNDDITLTTQAEMGKMDVDVICMSNHVYPISYMPGIPGWLEGPFEDYMNPLYGYISWDMQSVNVVVGDLYPGAMYGLDFKVKNTGDVPIKLSDVVINCSDNWNLFSKLTGTFQFKYQSAYYTSEEITVGPYLLSNATLGDYIANCCADLVLYPGDEIVGWGASQDVGKTIMNVFVDDTITGDEFEEQETAFTIDFIWEQCQPVYFGEIA